MPNIKPRLLIFEGPNGTGKSTCIKRMLEPGFTLLDWKLIDTARKSGSKPAENLADEQSFQQRLQWYADNEPEANYILDRHLFSSFAYGFLRGEKVRMSEVFAEYDWLSQRFELVQILLRPIGPRVHRGSIYLTEGQYLDVTHGYEELWWAYCLQTAKISWTCMLIMERPIGGHLRSIVAQSFNHPQPPAQQ